MDLIVKHWHKAKGTQELKQAETRVEAGDVAGGEAVMLALSKKLREGC